MMHYGYGMMGWVGGWIVMIFITVIAILGIVALLRYLQRPVNQNHRNDSSGALDILNERYAKGEISDDEYKRKKSEIKS